MEGLPQIPGLLKSVVPDSQRAEGWWTALEPLILPLVAAGYDSPEIVIARWDVPNQFLRLLAWDGYVEGANALVIVGDGDWKTFTGAAATVPPRQDSKDPLDGLVAISLRVRARHWLEKPIGSASPYPALPLAGIPFVDDNGTAIQAKFIPGPGPVEADPELEDPFAGPNDGWITFTQPYVGPPPNSPIHGNARLIGHRISSALAAAWNPSGGTPLGLVGCLNPAKWDSPRTYVEPLDNFNAVAAEIWEWIKTPANLEWVLTRDLRDSIGNESDASSIAILGKARSAKNHPFDPAKEDPFVAARTDLMARHGLLHPREANGCLAVDQLASRHWLILLFIFHEYQLIGLLPFGVSSTSILPPASVVHDIPPVDLTGLYETNWALVDEHGRPITATMQINQAGDCLDGWLTDAQFFRSEFTAALNRTTYKPSAGIQAPRLAFPGSFDGDSTSFVEVSDVPWPGQDSVGLDVLVTFNDVNGHPTERTLSRRDRRARMRPSLVGELLPAEVELALEPDGQDEDETEWWTKPRASLELQLTPLHYIHALGINAALDILCVDLNAMYDGAAKSRVGITTTRMLDSLVRNRILATPHVPDVSTPLLHRFRLDAHARLRAETVAVGVTCWDYFYNEVVVAEQTASQTLQDLLDVAIDAVEDDPGDSGYHCYEYSIVGYGLHGSLSGGVKAEIGGFYITCSIQHLAKCATVPGPHGWLEPVDYDGAMAEAAAGVGEDLGAALNGISLSSPNTLWTRGEWGYDDFAPSSIQTVALSVSASAHPIIGGEGVPPLPAGLPFGIDGSEVELVIFMSARGRAISEISPNTGWSAKIGVGLGADYTVSFGTTIAFLVRRTEDVVRPVAIRTFGNLQTDLSLGNFPEGGWQLSEGMRLVLARNVARYRSLLESPGAVVRIEGDTSTTATDEVNDPLSWKRTLAAYAWIRALLTTAKQPAMGTSSGLALSVDRIAVTGFGELQALNEGKLKQNVPDPAWRRVKVQINDQVVVFL